MRKFKKAKFFLFKYSYIIFLILLIVFNVKLKTYLFKTYPNSKERKSKIQKMNEDLNKKEFIYREKIDYFNINKLHLSDDWFLEIPNILEKAKIKEGTENKIIDNYIGHFLDTAKIDGNVALAAHNRGFRKNYFENLKDINIKDKIIYIVGGKKYEYIVYKKYIVDETDVSCLNDSEKREITLITCVMNKPSKRLVVKGNIVE